ncbi:MAG: hypothetical protein RLZZ314_863 [Bacteroidota bacterium]|jgi:putative redox protein
MAWNYTVRYEHPLRTLNTHLASGQTIVTDAPTDNHGLGEAFSPTDLLSTSLAACAMTIMGIHASSRSWSLVSMEARVQKTMAANPRRVAAIEIEFDISVSPDASEKELLALERAGRACPVARSLHPEIDQMLTFSFQRVSAEGTSE